MKYKVCKDCGKKGVTLRTGEVHPGWTPPGHPEKWYECRYCGGQRPLSSYRHKKR